MTIVKASWARVGGGGRWVFLAGLVFWLRVGVVGAAGLAAENGGRAEVPAHSSGFSGEFASAAPSNGSALLPEAPAGKPVKPEGQGLMEKVDLATLTLITGFSSLLQAVGFIVLWRMNPGIRGIGLWAVSASCDAVIMPLMWLRVLVDAPLLTMLLPTSLVLLTGGTFYAGAARFVGRNPQWGLPGTVAAVSFLGYLWFFFVDDQAHLRIACASCIIGVFLGCGAREMFYERRRGLSFAARLCGVSTGAMCLIMVLRAVAMPFIGPSATMFAKHPVQVIGLGSLLAWVMVWGFATVLLINQRHVFDREQSFQERMAAESALREAQLELAAERAQRQRRRLVRDLHDGFGGVTANLALLAASDNAQADSGNRPELLRHMEELAVAGNRELRSLMNCLESGSAHWGDFISELREHARQLGAAHHIEIDWHTSGGFSLEPIQDFPAVLSLSRAVKEAITNLARHSGATRATVRLSFRKSRLLVFIGDDGRGFDAAPPVPGSGRGLGNMRRRVEEMGGRFAVSGKRGTRMLFSLPLPLKSPEDTVDSAT